MFVTISIYGILFATLIVLLVVLRRFLKNYEQEEVKQLLKKQEVDVDQLTDEEKPREKPVRKPTRTTTTTTVATQQHAPSKTSQRSSVKHKRRQNATGPFKIPRKYKNLSPSELPPEIYKKIVTACYIPNITEAGFVNLCKQVQTALMRFTWLNRENIKRELEDENREQ